MSSPVSEFKRVLDEVTRETKEHGLMRWISRATDDDPRRRYNFAVGNIPFVMSFPYYNNCYLRYSEEEVGEDTRKQVINHHADEDATHALLFLEDIRRLKLEDVWGLDKPSVTLWGLLLNPRMHPLMRVASARIGAVVRSSDASPPLRFLHIEQIEREGNVFFQNTTAVARRIERELGMKPVYFGEYHLNRETGHVDIDEFELLNYTPDETVRGHSLLEHKRELSTVFLDTQLENALLFDQVKTPGELFARGLDEELRYYESRCYENWAGRIPSPWEGLAKLSEVHVKREDHPQKRIWQAWQKVVQGYADHRFVPLIGKRGKTDPAYTLRSVLLLFALRVCMLHTFFRDDLYREDLDGDAGDACEMDPVELAAHRRVNTLCRMLSTEPIGLLADWRTLGLDDAPWSLDQWLHFWFLDERWAKAEQEAMHALRREAHAVRHHPILRYWMIMVFDTTGMVVFPTTQPVARAYFEQEHGRPLTYLEGNVHLRYHLVTDDWMTSLDLGDLTTLRPLTPAEERQAFRIFDVYARLMRRQFDKLAELLEADGDCVYNVLRPGSATGL